MHIYRPESVGELFIVSREGSQVNNFKQKIDVNFIFLGRMSPSDVTQWMSSNYKNILPATKYCLSLRRVVCVAFLNILELLLF